MTLGGGPDRIRLAGILRLWIRLTVPEELRQDIVADLEDAARRRAGRGGRLEARARLWLEGLTAPIHVWRIRPPWAHLGGSALVSDARYALRRLWKRPGVAAVGVTVLALGIGGTTAVYSIFSPLVWPDPAVTDGAALRTVATRPGEPGYFDEAEIEVLGDLLEADVAGSGPVTVTVRAGADVVRSSVVAASAGYLKILDPPLHRGRLPISEGSGEPAPEVVASKRFFDSFFGERTDALGSTISIDGRPYVLVGVTAPEFQGANLLGAPDLWIPAESAGPDGTWVARPLKVVFRASPGVPDDALNARLAGGLDRLSADTLLVSGWIDAVIPRGERVALGQVGLILTVLGLVVLLAACANVANVLAAEGLARQREVALRRALGATRGRIVQELLVEAAVLGAGALLLALLLSGWLLELLPGWLPDSVLAVTPKFTLSTGALVLGGVLSAVAILAAGLLPALRTSRHGSLTGDMGRVRGPRTTAGDAMVVVQVAASVGLLAAAGILGRSVSQVREMDHGFEAEGLLTFDMDLSAVPEERGSPVELAHGIRGELEALPGVAGVTLSSQIPLFSVGTIRLPASPEDSGRFSSVVHAGDRYLETLGSRLVAGRDLRPGETEPVALVSTDLARELWPEEPALGKRLVVNEGEDPLEVVGLLAAGNYGYQRVRPMVVVPLRRSSPESFTVVVRGRPGVEGVVEAVRSRMRTLRPEAPPPMVVPASDWFDRAWLVNRALAALARVFGVLALFIGVVGIYGRFRQLVMRSRRAMGIRIALGATRSSVVGAVVRRSAILTTAGAILGALTALAGATVLGAILLELPGTHVPTYAVVMAVVVAASLGATLGPALRAARVDPVEVLQSE